MKPSPFCSFLSVGGKMKTPLGPELKWNQCHMPPGRATSCRQTSATSRSLTPSRTNSNTFEMASSFTWAASRRRSSSSAVLTSRVIRNRPEPGMNSQPGSFSLSVANRLSGQPSSSRAILPEVIPRSFSAARSPSKQRRVFGPARVEFAVAPHLVVMRLVAFRLDVVRLSAPDVDVLRVSAVGGVIGVVRAVHDEVGSGARDRW